MNTFSNLANFTLSQLNNSIKNLIENNFEIINVTGEVSGVKRHSSGHIYFSIKDEESIISVICWRSQVPLLNLEIEDGIKVIITGKITTYDKQSKYQLIVKEIKFQGEGSLLRLLEQRKKKLSELGFFNLETKKVLPKFPRRVGVITSKSGVVIEDIIHRISDRFPLELNIYPANVQGEKCLYDLLNGIEYFNNRSYENNLHVDLIIIARGGGSLEDLMPFNEESLVKAIYESSIPIVSAVGHETDFTLCDLVSDLRAPTPTGAAEMVVPDRKDLIIRVDELGNSLKKFFIYNFDNKVLKLKLLLSNIPDLQNIINDHFQSLDLFNQKLINLLGTRLKNVKISLYEFLESFTLVRFDNLVKDYSSKLFNSFEKINYFMKQILKIKSERISHLSKEISILSYKQTLSRGFAVVRCERKVMKSDTDIKKNQEIEIEFFKNKTLARKI